MRLFIGVAVPEPLKEKLLLSQKRIERLCDIKLVEPENLHFSLKFFGEVNEDRVKAVREVLTAAAEKFSQFTLAILGIGAFPSAGSARVVWAGCSAGAKELEALAGFIDSELSKVGFTAEERPFRAHLTLGRIRLVEKNPRLEKFILNNKEIEFGSFMVSKVSLMESQLSPTGPTYKEIFSVDLHE